MVKIQAESFPNLTNFVIENNSDAEGGSVIRISEDSGTATRTFDLPTGNYEVRLGYFDETDGDSTIDITIGDTELPTLTFNNPPPGAGNTPNADSFVNQQISSTVFIENGDLITINGTSDGGELTRIDFIEFNELDAPSADIFWRNSETGNNLAWIMDGTNLGQSNSIQSEPADSPWEMRGAGDFDSDEQKDILWRNTDTGDVGFWLMEGFEFKSGASSTQVSDLNWEIRGTGDFDSDGEEDILWRNTETGENAVWLMNGTELDQGVLITRENDGQNLVVPEDGLWQMEGAGDLDNDGDADILWRNTQNQDVYYWRMDGTEYVESVFIDSAPISGEWEIRGTMDFDDNGFDDVLLRNGTTGQNQIWLMNQTGLQQAVATESLTGDEWQSYV
ncbi:MULTISPECIES: VCBS repeat-containing protein [unclassified Moorena]|uniref:FG-GAP repeat domain-containing protein n=1 Tax=unclassified Moorena TaxID=2683338 RepID=UPI0013C6597F|nr:MULTISPECIES: VCBS repeat-containing protein [unclassified Moorena]NEO23173.1 VCBS repeat-containing protein [Moorena sp. SIO4A5]NEQ58042.1 VCBS repeat-containing protein [Moorena sp. SIO4A1]